MKGKLSIRYFAHSWISDWNHGNAHFLRGLAHSLINKGHEVRCYEQFGSWSLRNLVHQEGERADCAIEEFRKTFPELNIQFFSIDETLRAFLMEQLDGANVVIVHEWNEPEVVNTILALKNSCGFVVLFHDTHHRAYTNPAALLRMHLHKFDGVLAFGDAVRRVYKDGFGLARVWTFHEAADVDHFGPLNREKELDVVWIGNWGDEERTRELEEFLIEPAGHLSGSRFVVYGVRYPQEGLRKLAEAGIDYRGYLPNLQSPEVYSRSRLTLHVPRRQYANGLSGVPTIRVFEALACGMPLVCSPWTDDEGLFRPGQDYLNVSDGNSMKNEIAFLLGDDVARQQLANNGLNTIRSRHTTNHRADQLLEIIGEIRR